MSDVKWTDSQKKAIEYHQSSVIVSAAAGSGKTAVLVERIIRMLDKTDIDRLLVVTFTQAAAAQMRENIANALEDKIRSDISQEEKNLYHRQLLLLPGANISTLHSFCSKIIKENFEKAELSPDYSLAEPDRSNLLLSQAVEQLIENEYEEGTEAFLDFAGSYTSYKNDSALPDMVLNLYNFSRSVPYPNKWLDNVVEMYKSPEDFSWLELFSCKARENSTYALEVLGKFADDISNLQAPDEIEIANKYILPSVSADLISIKDCLNKLTDYGSAYDAFNELKIKNFPSISDDKIKNSALIIDFRRKKDVIKNIIANIKEQYLAYSVEHIKEFSALQYPHIKELVNLVKKLDEIYTLKKRTLNLLDFNDLEHIAINILTDEEGNPSECAKQISEDFDEIIVDEYQDTNDVQEAILNAVSGGKSNIFMVGDMKQSIYRFRNTAPELFLNKTESYSDDDNNTGKRIFLSSNFRSRKNILDFSNLVFEQLMSKNMGEIDYGENESLHYGANYPENDDAVEIEVIEKNEYTDFSGIEQESAVIARKINNLISSGYQVFDRKTNSMRNISYKDIVILLRNSKNVSDEMATFLTKCGIPVYNDGGKELLLSSIEVQTVISLLKIIDNPYNDIALISILRSLFYKFSDDLLMEINLSGGKDVAFYEKLKNFENEKITIFLKDLEFYKKQASTLSVYELCNLIIQKNMLLEFSATMPGGTQRVQNLRYFLRLANNYVKSSAGNLFGFLLYIDSFSSHSQGMLSPKILPDTSDVVTITTMHKSKGLEYPVVIIPMLGRALRNIDLSSRLLFHKNLGIAFDYINSEKHSKIKSPLRSAISSVISDEYMSEELRVLYVALTRAKEKLILIGSVENHANFLEKLSNAMYEQTYKYPAHITKSAKSYLMWIMLSVLRHKCSEKVLDKFGYASNTITELSGIALNFMDHIDFSVTENNNHTADILSVDIADEIREKLEYSVPDFGQGVFSKYSVSELKRYIETESDYKDYFEKLITLSDIDNPDITTSAQRGSIIHKVFELIDLKNISSAEDIRQFTENLVLNNVITEDQAKLIPFEKMFAFFSSELGQKLQNSDFVKREVPFNIHISEKFDIPTKDSLKVQLQGVIDCYFKDGDVYTIIDFKSDRITQQNKSSKIANYKKQLEFYCLALRTIYKDAKIKACIYFLDDNTTEWL